MAGDPPTPGKINLTTLSGDVKGFEVHQRVAGILTVIPPPLLVKMHPKVRETR